jgi:hydrocephalus-inducing protein
VALRNPLDTQVTLRGSTTSKLVTVPPTLVLPPDSVTPVTVSFRPLLVGEAEATLKLECPELGVYEWGLKLRGASTPPEKAITFNVPLGVREAQTFRFMHYLEEKADYKVWEGWITGGRYCCQQLSGVDMSRSMAVLRT